MSAAPEQKLVREGEAALAGEQDPGDGEREEREQIDEAADRHRKRQRRRRQPPPGQVDEEADDRRKHADRQQEKAEIIGRMADERDVVGELRLGRVEERRREQEGEGDQHDALSDPAERRGARTIAARPLSRDRDQKGEHAHEPDDQGEHDMDHQALVEEPDRPERRVLHARHPRQRQQQGEDARHRKRADGEPCPADELAPQRAGGRGGRIEPDRRGGRRMRQAAHPRQLAATG